MIVQSTYKGLLPTGDPAEEPFDIVAAKKYFRVDHSEEDDLVSEAIAAAREHCEAFTRRTFISTPYRLTLDNLREPAYRLSSELTPDSAIVSLIMPKPRLLSVESIKYYDSDGVQHTLPTESYDVDISVEPGQINFLNIPNVSSSKKPAWEINYTAGYGATASDLPKTLILLIKRLARHFYDNREDQVIPKDIERALIPYKFAIL